MDYTAGMGETGETYVVGEDYLMRSASRFSETSTVLQQRGETEAVDLPPLDHGGSHFGDDGSLGG